MAADRNDLVDFIITETEKLEGEYDRIQRRVKEDPGTAGDQGEENWASLLRVWLPPEYTVVTKGRILGHSGEASPQVDVVVLHPGYPAGLMDKKLFLAGGVAAAFECKLTLEGSHIRSAIQTSARIKRLTARRTGTPYLELSSPLLYGILSHSHSWKREASKPVENVTKLIDEADRETTKSPREMLDLVCIADLATWELRKESFLPRELSHYPGKCTTVYFPWVQSNPELRSLSPMGVLLLTLFRKLAWEDQRLRRMAEYFSLVLSGQIGTASGAPRAWDPEKIYSAKVLGHVEAARGVAPSPENVYGNSGGLWNQWWLSTDSLSSVSD